MSRETNIKLATNLMTALSQGDFDTFLSYHHDDVKVNMAGETAVSGHFDSKQEFFLDTTFQDVIGQLKEGFQFGRKWRIMCADENCVGVIMRGGGPTEGGDNYEQTYGIFYSVRDGKVAEIHEFFDTVLVERALYDNPLTRPLPPHPKPFEF